ncbi:hypothetical protein BH18ACT10_BH18ACT10_02230 [soil metagenome]|nr:hypothetical protein [Rubrobacter sp.]
MKILETERMVLRRMEMADVDDLMGIFSDSEAMLLEWTICALRLKIYAAIWLSSRRMPVPRAGY